MGNILDEGVWSIDRLALTIVWVYIVILVVYKYILIKPWGANAECRRAIDRCDVRRSKGFSEFRARVETNDDNVTGKRNVILAMPLLRLQEALQRNEFNAVAALEAYVWKALQVHERLNCCTEVIVEAFSIAEETDEKWQGKEGKPPLYGIPFSVKGNFFMKNYDCNLGLAKLLEQPKDEECSLVTHLRNLGATPFVLTNVPQGLLSFVCSNSVYGTTRNPHDVTRSPGGSSGGEAALIGSNGAAFGTGSDVAGSLRIPAAACGIIALKPTQDRFVVTGTHGGVPGRGRLGLSFGFFTHSVEEQIALLDLCVGQASYRRVTPLTPQCPLDVKAIRKSGSLRIGYFESDGFCPPIPAMRRSVRDTVEKLRAEGHEMVAFQIPEVNLMVQLLYKCQLTNSVKMLMPDGGAYTRSLYENDVVDPYMKQFVTLLKIPRLIRWLASYAINPICPQMAAICASSVSDVEDLRYSQEQVDDYRKKFIKYWQSLELDALICPAFPVCAVPHEYPSKLSIVATYTGLWNLVDFPAGVVPTDKVSKQDDEALMDESVFPVGYNLGVKAIRDACQNSTGLPCSVQIVTLPFEEEKCLRVMGEVERLWKKVEA